MYIIENEQVRAGINAFGAELQSLWHKQHALEYLWQGDAPFWAKRSPVLFPVVGTLRNNTYSHAGSHYHLPRHGFAREKTFELYEQTPHSITFVLHHSSQTLPVYPFKFSFFIEYALLGATLTCTYRVSNTGDGDMYFSVGAHPAFNVPLTPDTVFEDWYLQFNQTETSHRWPITGEGLIAKESEPFLQGNQLPLKTSRFKKDALVFKDLQSNTITLQSSQTPRGLQLRFEGFPFFGIWSTKEAPFVCLEPWCGIADSENAGGILQEKEGIVHLPQNRQWQRSWQVTLL